MTQTTEDTLRTEYLTSSSGMNYALIEAIDALLPALGGNPEDYVHDDGSLNAMKVMQPDSPHSHSTQAAADIILGLWNGRNNSGLYDAVGHFGQAKRTHLANALRAMADRLAPDAPAHEQEDLV